MTCSLFGGLFRLILKSSSDQFLSHIEHESSFLFSPRNSWKPLQVGASF